MDRLLEEQGKVQDAIEAAQGWDLDRRLEIAMDAMRLPPGDADVSFSQHDVLPAFGLMYGPFEGLTLRAAYSETVARQTFKELTPIVQQEYLGGPIFLGNPELEMSSLRNYDFRADWVPYEGGLFSASVFRKDIEKPIEYVEKLATFAFTTAVNYPRGTLSGIELETICRYNLPIVTVVLNNSGVYRGDDVSPSTDPAPTMLKARHERMIEAFGGTGHQATTPTEVASLLREALASGAPALIDCVIDPSDGTESGNIGGLNPQSSVRQKPAQ